MTSVCNKLIVLLWKCIILRKRNWVLSIFELASPILVVLLLWYVNEFLETRKGTVGLKYVQANQSGETRFNSSFRRIYNSPVTINESTYIAYAPNTTFTYELMRAYKDSVEVSEADHELRVEPKGSEVDLQSAMREHSLPTSGYSCVLGVLFSEPNATFKYKIIGDFKEVLEKTRNPYDNSMFFNLQVYLDAQYLKSVGVNYEATNVLIGEFLQSTDKSGNLDPQSLITLFLIHVFFTLAYTFLVAAVVRDTIQEKSSGIKELMRIMGLSSWMIWIHWFIYCMLVQIPVTVVITVLLTCVPPLVFEANVFMVWLLLFLVTIDYIVIFFVVTCFFDRATTGTILCVICWIVINFAFVELLLPRSHSYPFQILISLIPLINLNWALLSLDSFHLNEIEWNLSLLFTEGYTGSQVSAGLAIVIFVCEIILFTLLLAYLDAVKPGHYGVAKHVAFVFGCCVNRCQDKHTPPPESSSLPAQFELPPPGTTVGIRVRGLHKEFGLFNKKVAVESVNLDIYEGEVTVLLGHNGAGKTTTMSMITGMFSPTSGTVTVDGVNIYDRLYDYRQNLGLCTQHNLYFPKLTLLEHLVFFGMLKGRSRSQAREEGIHLLQMLNLVDKKDLRGSQLSGGMQRRLCLAVALTAAPKVLILDEPTSGLDPENRRYIWDIILSLRGERTILITTHYMEEADVLGDRIAIMDHGKVVCCGTTMFLKKMFGTGYVIHVTKNPKAPLKDIKQCIQNHIPRFVTKEVSPTQIDFTIKDEFVARFPDLFFTLESAMSSLGVTAITVSCTSMEDVFLRVAELSEEQDHGLPKAIPALRENYEPVQGFTLTLQRIEALLIKRALYISKVFISTIIKLAIACLLMLSATLLTNSQNTDDNKVSSRINQREVDLTMYPDSLYPIIYDESNKRTAQIAQNIIKNREGEVVMKMLENSSQYGHSDTIYQPMHKLLTQMDQTPRASNRTVVASTFFENDFLVQYRPALNPLASVKAANLIANILLQRVHPDRSIEITGRALASERKTCDETGSTFGFTSTVFYLTATIPCALTVAMSYFIPLTIEERVTGFKYQQIIAGVSPLMFWLSNLFFDFCLYLVFIIVSLVIIVIFGCDAMSLSSENMMMLILVLILYGVSFLIFLNVFTYISNSSAIITGLYIVLNLAFMLVCPISLIILHSTGLMKQILFTSILSLHPTAAAFFAIYNIATGIANDSVCIYSQPIESFLGLPSSSNRNSIFIYVLFLVLDAIVYSTAIIVIDNKIFARMWYKRSTIDESQRGDDDVKHETLRVRMFKEADVDTTPLRVEGLVKNYRSFRAANQVSFLVSWGECFGLLGVNGAGKTTSFKMLTGEVTPSSGDAFSIKYSVMSQTRKYLLNIGYCPQFDAILDDLTGRNTLSIIAKIRGVPRKEVRGQVDFWLTTLGIEEHADKRTKTYSGGTKRKLGTAMAFIGEPIVALLDEPTTGVDPAARRKVWSAVKDRQSSGYSAVLTSHSMEECEALCTRLTIMRQGEMCCIGTVEGLKSKFGQGYVVSLKIVVTQDYEAQLAALKNEFLKAFPKSTIQDENFNVVTYRVLDSKTPLSRLFSEAIRLKKKYAIVDDFMVSNATLEQLFLEIARGKDTRSVNQNVSHGSLSMG